MLFNVDMKANETVEPDDSTIVQDRSLEKTVTFQEVRQCLCAEED